MMRSAGQGMRIGTPGYLLGLSITRRMRRPQIKQSDRALQSIAYIVDQLCAPVGAQHADFTVGTNWIDTFKTGEIFVAYSDANPKGGNFASNVWTSRVEEAQAAASTLSHAQRHRRRLELALRRLPQNQPQRATDDAGRQTQLEAAQTELTELVGLLISDDDFETIRSIASSGGIPTVAIVARTTFKGGAAASLNHFVERLPVTGLGTVPAAGNS